MVELPGLKAALLEERAIIAVHEASEKVRFFSEKRLPKTLQHTLLLTTEGRASLRYVSADTMERLSLEQEAQEKKLDADKAIVNWVNGLIHDAVEKGASDIHIEPREEALFARFRIDGHLQTERTFGLEYRDEILSRLKVLADLDIAEKRRPQDGKIQMRIRGRSIDFRVSSIPIGKGEKMVIRILDKSQLRLDLSSLGMPDQVLEPFRRVIRQPYGMLLVTGPTGSGKTTTLYAALKEIQDDQLNIMTIEDPIEYQINGINQSQVRPNIGYGFSESLRSFLRQDPNVIMVGEVRDKETAEMSIRAALTGHLVLSTLHTNTAVGCIPRLTDMGIAPYLIAASLQLAIGQRLLRKLCPDCKEEDPNAAVLGKKYNVLWNKYARIYRGKGCFRCNGQGYLGRIGVYESFVITEKVKQAIHENLPEQSLAKLQPTYIPMLQNGLSVAEKGITSFDELLREIILT